MWLLLDVGNSAVKGAVGDAAHLADPFAIPHAGSSGDASDILDRLAARVRAHPPDRIALVSVVPALAEAVCARLGQTAGVAPEVIDVAWRLPFTLDYATPQTLGTDRLAAAVGAWMHASEHPPARPVVVIDAGTATTFEVIDEAGVYRGGAILPGPTLLSQALSGGTAQLPDVPLVMPPTAIGRSTTEALQVGIMGAFVEGVRGLLRRLTDHLGEPPALYLTGGWSAVLSAQLGVPHQTEPYLVLDGLRHLLVLNPRAA